MDEDLTKAYAQAQAYAPSAAAPTEPYLLGAPIPPEIMAAIELPHIAADQALLRHALKQAEHVNNPALTALLEMDLKCGPLAEPTDSWGFVINGRPTIIGDFVQIPGDQPEIIRVERIFSSAAAQSFGGDVFIQGIVLTPGPDPHILTPQPRSAMAPWTAGTRTEVLTQPDPTRPSAWVAPALAPVPALPAETSLLPPVPAADPEDALYDMGIPLPPGLGLKAMVPDKRSPADVKTGRCVFCGGSTDLLPPIATGRKSFMRAHEMCALSLPEVWRARPEQLQKAGVKPHVPLDGWCWFNIAKAARRCAPLRCAKCNKLGAGVGCWVASCRVTMHYHCAVSTEWEFDEGKHGMFYCEKHRNNIPQHVSDEDDESEEDEV